MIYTHATVDFPRVTIADVKDHFYASHDSTGRCRADNPLKDWEPDEWYPLDDLTESHPWLESFLQDKSTWNFMFRALSATQVVACGPPMFDYVYMVCLLTKNETHVSVEGFVESL